MVWLLLKEEESKLVFLRSGLNMAIFKASGKVPVNKEWLTILNNSSERQLKQFLKM